MMSLFDKVAFESSLRTTNTYSTSFSLAVRMLSRSLRKDIHGIYGFVRFADEIVDTFEDFDQKYLLEKFEVDCYEAIDMGISLNPILHAFQQVVNRYNIPRPLIDSFLASMKLDLTKQNYTTQEDYQEYIYGSADVVGLMCLKVFVNGNDELYEELKDSAMRLGSAFQKVNFLRDLKTDTEILNRNYFPNLNLLGMKEEEKELIIAEIKDDFDAAYKGILRLPNSSKFGVYSAYVYYQQLLKKLESTASNKILEERIRVRDHVKLGLLIRSYMNVKLNLV